MRLQLNYLFRPELLTYIPPNAIDSNSLLLCSRGAPHGPLQFGPSQEVCEVRLQQICLRLVVSGNGLPHLGDEDQALLLLVTGQTFAFFPQLGNLEGNIDHAPGSLDLVVTAFDLD